MDIEKIKQIKQCCLLVCFSGKKKVTRKKIIIIEFGCVCPDHQYGQCFDFLFSVCVFLGRLEVKKEAKKKKKQTKTKVMDELNE